MKATKLRPTPKLVWNQDYWLFRAEEARAMGSEIRDPECRRIMTDIAESYDQLAKHAKDFHAAAAQGGRQTTPDS